MVPQEFVYYLWRRLIELISSHFFASSCYGQSWRVSLIRHASDATSAQSVL